MGNQNTKLMLHPEEGLKQKKTKFLAALEGTISNNTKKKFDKISYR